MSTEKEILLIKALLSEGVEELREEFWITKDGDLIAAYDQTDHDTVAMEHALGIDVNDPELPEMTPYYPLSDEAISYLQEQGADEEAIEYFKDGSEPRVYALKNMGWTRVDSNRFTVWELNRRSLLNINNFLHEEMHDGDSGVVHVEQLNPHGFWSIPAKIIMSPQITVNGIKNYEDSTSAWREDVLHPFLLDN
jgi:hypothetical protein